MSNEARRQAILVLTIVCFFIGLITMVQWRTQAEITRQTGTASIDELTSTLIQAEKSKDALASQLVELQNQVNRYRDGESAKHTVQQLLTQSQMAAGMVAVEGPGVVITLDDSPLARQFDEQSRKDIRNEYYIHDTYLRELVNALWMAGAEAVSVNQQRLVANSEIFCGGTTIFINRDYVTPPFVIRAVGDPKTLTASLNMVLTSLLLKDLNQRFGVVFDIAPSDRVQIPEYRGDIQYQHAKISTKDPAAEAKP
ncbi:DUF881 domain-containing protein [Heliophilum fasciatum]|uniref:Uncharacterized protein YlxW (UPF0749 family) n=1 Tax=Heliophilum fasciatum TaxID=35700 RepID=A0A4R2RWG7_9FIRM|nr:DUF881 domain-containing protein [Heliophilum fasciatum]MCW2278520.1 uncharacterized protein YlxW (UPF0749 family) [Heliophilum fasciatum]TCP63475.1 uncharacterized protein YlxW (UPF0749 family) [Heliophilum fasciatum]